MPFGGRSLTLELCILEKVKKLAGGNSTVAEVQTIVRSLKKSAANVSNSSIPPTEPVLCDQDNLLSLWFCTFFADWDGICWFCSFFYEEVDRTESRCDDVCGWMVWEVVCSSIIYPGLLSAPHIWLDDPRCTFSTMSRDGQWFWEISGDLAFYSRELWDNFWVFFPLNSQTSV